MHVSKSTQAETKKKKTVEEIEARMMNKSMIDQ